MAKEWKKDRPSWHNWPLIITERADDRYLIKLQETAGLSISIAEFDTFAKARDHANECLAVLRSQPNVHPTTVLVKAGLRSE